MLEYSSIIPSTNTSNTTTTINNNNNNTSNSNSGSSSNLPIPNGLPVSMSPIGQGRKEGARSGIASMHDRQGSVSLFPAMPTASLSLPTPLQLPSQLPSSLSMPMRGSIPLSSTTKDDESSSSVSSHLRILLPSERGGGGLRGMDAMMVDDVHQPRQVTPSLIYTPCLYTLSIDTISHITLPIEPIQTPCQCTLSIIHNTSYQCTISQTSPITSIPHT